VRSVDEQEQRLLVAAYDEIREGQRRLHALAEEARLLYQRRLGEWEQCRHSLEQVSVQLRSHSHHSLPAPDPDPVAFEQRTQLLDSEALLRDRHAEIAERLYGAQRVARLLGAAIRQMEQQSALLQRGEGDTLTIRNGSDPDSNSYDRMIQAYEQERLRLAREIHDGPAQILANAIFEMEYFERLLERDPDTVKSNLSRLKSDMREGLTEVRRFIFDLRPPALSEMGLFVALRRYAADFEKHFGISMEVDLPDAQERLSSSKEVALFRVAQEALQNVQKHAGASRVTIRGRADQLVMSRSIEDNGRGFDLTRVASRHSRNLGLISMRERAELIGAQLQVASSPGRGTRISIAVPLDHSGTA
jgi:two-component system, NarL family, sensor histidine kinase DegS